MKCSHNVVTTCQTNMSQRFKAKFVELVLTLMLVEKSAKQVQDFLLVLLTTKLNHSFRWINYAITLWIDKTLRQTTSMTYWSTFNFSTSACELYLVGCKKCKIQVQKAGAVEKANGENTHSFNNLYEKHWEARMYQILPSATMAEVRLFMCLTGR